MRWQTDRDLASVRGPEALAQLPEKERKAWSALWEHVSVQSEYRRKAIIPELATCADGCGELADLCIRGCPGDS